MKIAIIDGQGGGLGSSIIQKLKENLSSEDEILAFGTNAIATSQMMKSGAQKGASGENAICRNAPRVDLIIGPIGILLANAMLGEVTPAIAEAVASSPAHKIVLPITTCNVDVVGKNSDSLPEMIRQIVEKVLQFKEGKQSS
ncbi:MAG: DUF3842 family protein [Calditrichaeota bacterium]|nr:DUF3842 family protein [Calditrichota bacterium]